MSESPADVGRRTRNGVVVTTPEGEPLSLRLDLRYHSPTGFEMGYGGSGPAQLSLALLAHCMGDKVALQYYQDFKWEVIAMLPRDGWTLTPKQIMDAVDVLTLDRE